MLPLDIHNKTYAVRCIIITLQINGGRRRMAVICTQMCTHTVIEAVRKKNMQCCFTWRQLSYFQSSHGSDGRKWNSLYNEFCCHDPVNLCLTVDINLRGPPSIRHWCNLSKGLIVILLNAANKYSPGMCVAIKTCWRSVIRPCFLSVWGMKGEACVYSSWAPSGNLVISNHMSGQNSISQAMRERGWTFETEHVCLSVMFCSLHGL